MLLQQTNIVTENNGPRSSGKPNHCFYCGQEVGASHRADCVCRVKVVMVEVSMTIPRIVPANWDESMVNFNLNESSWCADNISNDINRYINAKNQGAPCMCGTFCGKLLRDATEKDLKDIDLAKLLSSGE
jgi:hypothetical protein